MGRPVTTGGGYLCNVNGRPAGGSCGSWTGSKCDGGYNSNGCRYVGTALTGTTTTTWAVTQVNLTMRNAL